jgi:hypothetical protein
LSGDGLAAALADFERRSLASFETKLASLVYVASLRDYNTGLYRHDGLIALYGALPARAALESCHRQLFQQVAAMPASELLSEFSEFIKTADAGYEQVLESWQTLKAYQTLIPIDSDQVSAELFISKMNITLVILHLRHIRKTEAATNTAGVTPLEVE